MNNKKGPTLGFLMLVKSEIIDNLITDVLDQYFDDYAIVSDRFNNYHPKIINIDPGTHPELYINFQNNTYINFSKVRNLAQSKLKTDYITWLDFDDDIFSLIDYIKTLDRQKYLQNGEVDAVLSPYYYLKDKKNYYHYNIRIYKRAKYDWGDLPVHETVTQKNKNEKLNIILDNNLKIIHNKTSDNNSSIQRNFNILRWAVLQKEYENKAIIYFYLGREAASFDNDLSIESFSIAIQKNIETDYRFLCHFFLSELYYFKGDLWKSLEEAINAYNIYTYSIEVLLQLSRLYYNLGDVNSSLVKLNTVREYLDNDLIVQQNYTIKSGFDLFQAKKEYLMLYVTILHNERSEKVLELLPELISYISSEEENYRHIIEEIILYWEAKFSNQKKYEKHNFDFIVESKKKRKNRKKYGNKSIVIYAPLNYEEWDAETVRDKGAGGSETALVEVSERLVKYGYDVELYANPIQEREINGVRYYKASNIDLSADFNIFIGFRQASIFNITIDAKQRLLWLQDVGFLPYYTPKMYNQLDKILVLSKYHRNTLKHIPENKFFYTTNGIDVRLIEEVENELTDKSRNDKRFLYCSSPDRGLEELADIWLKLQQEKIIDGTYILDWYYGWESWNKRKIPSGEQFKQKMIKKLSEAGIRQMGRVGKKELYKAMFTSNCLLYPYKPPAETSCIVVMEAQATGLIPVTTGKDALAETQQWGNKAEDLDLYERYVKAIIEDSKNNGIENTKLYRREMMNWARKKFNWDNVVKNWVEELLI